MATVDQENSIVSIGNKTLRFFFRILKSKLVSKFLKAKTINRI